MCRFTTQQLIGEPNYHETLGADMTGEQDNTLSWGSPSILEDLTNAVAHQIEVLLLLAGSPTSSIGKSDMGVTGCTFRVQRPTTGLARGMAPWVEEKTMESSSKTIIIVYKGKVFPS